MEVASRPCSKVLKTALYPELRLGECYTEVFTGYKSQMLVRSMQSMASMQTYQTAFKQETQERPSTCILSWSKPVGPWTSLAWIKGLNLRNLFAVPWECGLFLPLPCPEHNSIEIRNSTLLVYKLC